MKINETISFIIVVLFSAAFLLIGNRVVSVPQEEMIHEDADVFRADVLRAVVTEIVSHEVTQNEIFWGTGTDTEIVFKARITTRGERRGEIVTATQHLREWDFTDDKEVERGDRIRIFFNYDGNIYFTDYVRANIVAVMAAIFLTLVVVFAKRKGFNAIVALGFTCLAIFFVFIPALEHGRNIYAATIILCIYSIISTLLLVVGADKKAFAAMLGCFGGVIFASILMFISDALLHLTGRDDEYSRLLLGIFGDTLDLRALIFAGVILGAVGAIMDVSMSIASSLWELRLSGGVTDFKGFVKSGVNIGKDILGTMMNTLVLAYIGSSLSLILVISGGSASFTNLLDRELIIVEFVRALVGSFGMLLAIPLTAVVCGWLYEREKTHQ